MCFGVSRSESMLAYRQSFLRYSKWDAMLIAMSAAQAVALLMAPPIPAVALGIWWNSNTIAHNFVHLPFFRSGKMNGVYSIFLTMLLSFPQSLWRQRHLAHHRGQPSSLRITPM